MFKPMTRKISDIFKKKGSQVKFLDKKIFSGKTIIYIDWANVYKWQEKLEWHIDTRRLFQFLTSFNQVSAVKLYEGYFEDNERSRESIQDFKDIGYEVRTKPVKEIHISIDARNIPLDDITVIKRVVSNALIRKLPVEAIEQINQIIRDINQGGDFHLIQHKCNFDVEMASDIRIDSLSGKDINTFVIVSGDSDFIDTVESLISEKKNVVIFGTSGRISYELSNSNAFIYDVKQIKNYICWNREREV
jgi:uncharacterized LabA/DUF88 family protein